MELIDLDKATAYDQAITQSSANQKLLVCGTKQQCQHVIQGAAQSQQNINSIIQASKEIDVDSWFQTRKQRLNRGLVGLSTDNQGLEPINNGLKHIEGTWPESVNTSEELLFVLDKNGFGDDSSQFIQGIRLTVESPWAIPAYFNYGGWNDCPTPDVQCAVWRYWEEKYGAQIVGLSDDIVEAFVLNPPTNKDSAMQLAWEQFFYCTDIILQGSQSASNLAASLLNRKSWFFWWD